MYTDFVWPRSRCFVTGSFVFYVCPPLSFDALLLLFSNSKHVFRAVRHRPDLPALREVPPSPVFVSCRHDRFGEFVTLLCDRQNGRVRTFLVSLRPVPSPSQTRQPIRPGYARKANNDGLRYARLVVCWFTRSRVFKKIERNGETSHNTVSAHVRRVSLCSSADSSRRVRYVVSYA